MPVSRRDRPAKPALSRAGVVAAAMRVMRDEGLERVTMRRLATELDTGPASLYVYLRNTAELHGALIDQLLAEADLPGRKRSGDWREDLIGLLSDYTVLLMGQPSLARSALTLQPSGPHFLRLVDALLALMHDGGIGVRQAAWGVNILLQHATATAAEQDSRDESPDATEEFETLAVTVREAPATDYPAIDRARDELFSGTGAQRQHWAFAAVIEGIARTPVEGTA